MDIEPIIHLNFLLGRALPLFAVNQEPGATPEELELESAFSEDLFSIIAALYSIPGIQFMAGESSEVILNFVLDHYRANPEELEPLREVLERYSSLAFLIGGGMAQDLMDNDGDPAEPTEGIIGSRVDSLTDPDGRPSLIRTTANDLARFLSNEDNLEGGVPAALTAYALRRATTRSTAIAETESVYHSRRGMFFTYLEEGLQTVEFRTQADVQVCPICRPLHGKVYETRLSIPAGERIPLHAL